MLQLGNRSFHFLLAGVVVASRIEISRHLKKGRRAHTSNRVFSAIILWKPIPTPSITASRHAHPIAEFLAAFAPPRMARAPPVKKPAMTRKLSALTPSFEARHLLP
jgi:hypothetical protein